MEKDPNKKLNPSLENSEIQNFILGNERQIEEIKVRIEEGFRLIKERVDALDIETAYLEHMENEKIMLELQQDIMGKKDTPKYSVEDSESTNREIENIRLSIKELQSQIDEMLLQKITFDFLNDQFNELQKKFNEIILRIDSSQLN